MVKPGYAPSAELRTAGMGLLVLAVLTVLAGVAVAAFPDARGEVLRLGGLIAANGVGFAVVGVYVRRGNETATRIALLVLGSYVLVLLALVVATGSLFLAGGLACVGTVFGMLLQALRARTRARRALQRDRR